MMRETLERMYNAIRGDEIEPGSHKEWNDIFTDEELESMLVHFATLGYEILLLVVNDVATVSSNIHRLISKTEVEEAYIINQALVRYKEKK